MSYRDIQKHVAELYGLEISDGAITHITDKLLPELKAWQTTPSGGALSFCLARCHSLQDKT
ncbi:transposase [Candidatus Arsenophonus triatominarum]|uniref:transposase n=1 Tax=Candidatus Arsenophonus triatominarum TaxID=57911 RepID=UPI0007C4B091|nr:transposase [Candidatus Arsenophonus triatominarum]